MNNEIRESVQKMVTALKKYECQMLRPEPFLLTQQDFSSLNLHLFLHNNLPP